MVSFISTGLFPFMGIFSVLLVSKQDVELHSTVAKVIYVLVSGSIKKLMI